MKQKLHSFLLVLLLFCGGLPCAALLPQWPTIEPFWPHYPSRNVTVLTGTWDFGMSPNATCDPMTIRYGDISFTTTMDVPSAFDVAPMGVLGPRHPCIFYRSLHRCTTSHQAIIKFYAVNFYTRIFIDGVELGQSTVGGYTPFEFLLPSCGTTGQREVLVVVSNTMNSSTCPTCTGGDFYFYSGIIRPVIVTEFGTAATSLWINRIEPVTLDNVKCLIDVRVVVEGTLPSPPESVLSLSYGFNAGPLGANALYPLVNNTAVIPNVVVPDCKLWGLGQGNLYTLTVQETTQGDTMTVRSGVRLIGVDSSRFLYFIGSNLLNMGPSRM